MAVIVVWLTISTTVAAQYLGASNVHVFRCIYCKEFSIRWNHQCPYNDMNYHIASRGLFHGGHVGFTPTCTQRTDKIRLPSYSPYQKTHVDIKFVFLRYFFRESMIICYA